MPTGHTVENQDTQKLGEDLAKFCGFLRIYEQHEMTGYLTLEPGTKSQERAGTFLFSFFLIEQQMAKVLIDPESTVPIRPRPLFASQLESCTQKRWQSSKTIN